MTRMANASYYDLWKVQKNHAVNRKGSFNLYGDSLPRGLLNVRGVIDIWFLLIWYLI